MEGPQRSLDCPRARVHAHAGAVAHGQCVLLLVGDDLLLVARRHQTRLRKRGRGGCGRCKYRRRLVQFAPFDSQSTWVWVPGITWSPDSRFIATVVHGHSGVGLPEQSPLFDLWILSADGAMVVPVARDVGMWANPAWSPWMDDAQAQNAILFGVAENPAHSELSLYELHIIDRDGSNRRRVFPPPGERGVDTVEIAWAPKGNAAALAFQGDLYLLNTETGQVQQLTADGNSSHVRWAR